MGAMLERDQTHENDEKRKATQPTNRTKKPEQRKSIYREMELAWTKVLRSTETYQID